MEDSNGRLRFDQLPPELGHTLDNLICGNWMIHPDESRCEMKSIVQL